MEPFFCILAYFFAALAQLVERFHGKEEVAGSSPASGFYNNLAGLAQLVEQLICNQ